MKWRIGLAGCWDDLHLPNISHLLGPVFFTVGKACYGFYHEEVKDINEDCNWRVGVLSLRVFCRHYFIIEVFASFRVELL